LYFAFQDLIRWFSKIKYGKDAMTRNSAKSEKVGKKSSKGELVVRKRLCHSRETKSKRNKLQIAFCLFCGKPFPTASPQRRKYCCLAHQRDFINWRWLKRAFEEGRLNDWRVSLLNNLEKLMRKAREETARELGVSVEELERMIRAFDAQPNADAQQTKEGGDRHACNEG
jgi:hypothetical protein